MAIDYRLVKPHPDAVATELGWELPSTGEILSSIKGLKTLIGSLMPVKKPEPVVNPTPAEDIVKPVKPKKVKPIEVATLDIVVPEEIKQAQE